MNTVVWFLQVLLALGFLTAGSMKVFRYDIAQQTMRFTEVLPRLFVTFIGVLEIVGAIGLVLPAATGQPWLTTLAAAGLVALMIAACTFNVWRGDYSELLASGTFLVLSAAALYYRVVVVPL